MADKTLTPYQQQKVKIAKKIKENLLIPESNVVSIFFKNPSLMFDYTHINSEMFLNQAWKLYYTIAHDLVIKEKKEALDEYTVGFYIERHPDLKDMYDKFGGYTTIDKATEYVDEKNIEGYSRDLIKWNTIFNLLKNDFLTETKLKEYSDMNLDDIYREIEATINHIFINANDDVKTVNISKGIDDLIDELNAGSAVGLPYANMNILNKETGGQLFGNITLIGGISNSGKTTLVRNMCIPSTLKFDEKLVIMLNEEGVKKWQREFLVWVANNIFKYDLQKYIVRDGNYDEETMNILRKSADWIKEKTKDNIITIATFKKYNTNTAIKVIKKYANMGVKYFILDTYKADSGSTRNESSWYDMQQNMVDLYDTIKPDSGLNVHLAITFQLSKSSSRQRYYQQDNIGMAKNIVDVSSTCIMIRDVFEDEYDDGKKELKCYKFEGKNKKSKVPVTLEEGKHYQVIFVVKNREGSANQYQIVCEHDMSRNILKEVGITNVPVDF